MAQVNRFRGLTGTIAMKAPVAAATTANITLSGLQTIDDVLLETLDRVLVKNQTLATQNGIWVAEAGAWARAADFDGVLDVVAGTTVPVMPGGAAQGGTYWQVISATEVLPGTTSFTFELARLNITPTVRFDEVSSATYSYIGKALPASLESAAVWQVSRLTNADNTLVFASGNANYDKVWNNRLSLTYT